MTSSHPTESKDSSHLETATLKKGLLWQQWDRFFSRWKERFFVLTRDYLACFKKGSSLGITEMGSFLYKVNLVDVEGLQWVDKKRDGVIAIKVGQDGQLLLWSPKGLDDWMFALRDAISRSKGRREALRKAHTLIPQISNTGLLRRLSPFPRGRQAMTLQHTLSDSHVERSILHSTSAKDFSGSLRSSTEHQPTPHLGKRSQRISDIVIPGDSEMDLGYDSEMCLRQHNSMGPRIAPQCAAGSHSSLASLGKGLGLGTGVNPVGLPSSGGFGGFGTGFSFSGFSTGGGHGSGGQLYRPSPRSLQVSPALTQRSLYAQHVLSAPEIAPSPEMRQSRSAATNVTSEFSFIRPDSPISRNDNGNGGNGSNGGNNTGTGSSSNTTSSLRSMREYHRSHSCSSQALSSNLTGSSSNSGTPNHLPGTPRNGGLTNMGGSVDTPLRPSSIYGQPMGGFEKSSMYLPKNALQLQQQHLMQPQMVAPVPTVQQPDVVPVSFLQNFVQPSQQSSAERPQHQYRNHRRPIRQYLHSKSDSSFVAASNHVNSDLVSGINVVGNVGGNAASKGPLALR